MRSKKGQSLIEAMVALSVLTVGFLGILSLLSKSFFYGRDVSDTMKATYLASEGIEITKNLIDNEIAAGNGWGSCFAKQGFLGFEVDYTTSDCNNLIPYNNSGDPLFFDSDTYLYGYANPANTTQTNFTREIMTTLDATGDEITVRSIVTWNTGLITNQKVIMEDHFYNWRPQK